MSGRSTPPSTINRDAFDEFPHVPSVRRVVIRYVRHVTAADGTVLAAIIAAAVVALTFLATEILKAWTARREQRAASVGRLLEAIDDFTEFSMQRATRFAPGSWFRRGLPETRVYTQLIAAGTGLYAGLPKRDHRVADWICWRLLSGGQSASVETISDSAQVRAIAVTYLRNRLVARRFVRRHDPAFEEWLQATFAMDDPSVSLSSPRSQPAAQLSTAPQ